MSILRRNFNFLKFCPESEILNLNTYLINNSYNYQYFKILQKTMNNSTCDLYNYYLHQLFLYSQNVYLVDGIGNNIIKNSQSIIYDKIRFCIGDFDSLYDHAFIELNKLNIPFIHYNDQDLTDLEKCLKISYILNDETIQTKISDLNSFNLINPDLNIEAKDKRFNEVIKENLSEIFMNSDDQFAKLNQIHESISKIKPNQTIIYDFMGNRSDHFT